MHRYNSRGLVRPRCYLGFYLDLSAAKVGAAAARSLPLECLAPPTHLDCPPSVSAASSSLRTLAMPAPRQVSADAQHLLELSLPALPSGAFAGVFLENVESEYTEEVEDCVVSRAV